MTTIPRRRALALGAAVPVALAIGAALPTTTVAEPLAEPVPAVRRLPVMTAEAGFIEDRPDDSDARVFCANCGRTWRWWTRPSIGDDCTGGESRVPVRVPGRRDMVLERTTTLHHLYDLESAATWVTLGQARLVAATLDRLTELHQTQAVTDADREAACQRMDAELEEFDFVTRERFGERIGRIVGEFSHGRVIRWVEGLPTDEA